MTLLLFFVCPFNILVAYLLHFIIFQRKVVATKSSVKLADELQAFSKDQLVSTLENLVTNHPELETVRFLIFVFKTLSKSFQAACAYDYLSNLIERV